MHRLFISDLHLSEATPEIEAALNNLLEKETDLDSLVILGDFFEAWVGDDDDSSLAHRVRSLLSKVSSSGCELMITRGNRDFMLGEQFARDTGATLLGDETVIDVAGTPTLASLPETVTSAARVYWETGGVGWLRCMADLTIDSPALHDGEAFNMRWKSPYTAPPMAS